LQPPVQLPLVRLQVSPAVALQLHGPPHGADVDVVLVGGILLVGPG